MTNNDKNISTEAYQQFLGEIVHLVQNHRVLAVQTVQTVSNQLYWSIGELIIKKQQEHGWGKSIVEKLSKDLTRRIGEGVSWSPRNLWFMRQLVEEYSNVNQAGSHLKLKDMNQAGSEKPNVKQLVSHLEFKNMKQLVSEVWKLSV